MHNTLTRADKGFVVFCYVSLILFTISVLLPIINLLAVATSGETEVIAGRVTLLPKQLQLDAFHFVLGSNQFFTSFRVSLLMTAVGSVLGLLFSIMAAYPLSKPNLPGRKAVLLAFVFTMMFNGGIVPQYLLMQKLHLLNTIWSVLFPLVTNVFNMLIIKSFMEGLPEEIEESAKMDGATPVTTLIRIILPLCMPVVATIGLFYAVEIWNEYFHSRLYLSSRSLMPLQLYLRTVIFEAMDPSGGFTLDSTTLKLAPQSIINATVLLSMLPMAVLYPFVQRFFVQGLVLGSVKG
ncbi:carbohydrate ABC transporter permease [Paenibacillus koleovorans]|uniref:carbohydrate ABC transporter permease n=1 Tax=Paenibacillus koleovorans TaxID=121608 RepID=UPI0013E3C7E3|nr:carbohydrate ABC transporter permease [Paenibacillus koleovorans]